MHTFSLISNVLIAKLAKFGNGNKRVLPIPSSEVLVFCCHNLQFDNW